MVMQNELQVMYVLIAVYLHKYLKSNFLSFEILVPRYNSDSVPDCTLKIKLKAGFYINPGCYQISSFLEQIPPLRQLKISLYFIYQ